MGCDLEGQVSVWNVQDVQPEEGNATNPPEKPLHVIRPPVSPYAVQADQWERRKVTVVTAHADAYQVAVLLYYNSQSSYYLRVLDFLADPDGGGGGDWQDKKTRSGRKRRILC